MNERIRELAEQAEIEFIYDPTETPIRVFAECWEDELEKFAQLIVRECCEQVIIGPNGPAHYAVEAALRLKKHFGVEE